jgi:uncharacterized protein (DUF983 family)
MFEGLRSFWRGMLGRCPHCGYGHIFRTFYVMAEGCAQCGRRYEGTGDQSTGAMGISLTLTLVVGFSGGILVVLYSADNLTLGMILLLLALSIFQALIYRVSRGLWIGLLCVTGAMDEDEHREEFYL